MQTNGNKRDVSLLKQRGNKGETKGTFPFGETKGTFPFNFFLGKQRGRFPLISFDLKQRGRFPLISFDLEAGFGHGMYFSWFKKCQLLRC
jgi:hypothetical protein